MLVLSRSLLRGAELELPELMGYIGEELVLWLEEPDMGSRSNFQRCNYEVEGRHSLEQVRDQI
jgi:hypothetical protein